MDFSRVDMKNERVSRTALMAEPALLSDTPAFPNKPKR